MTGTARMLLAAAVLTLLLTTASAGRTGVLAGDSPVKDTLSSLPAESTVPVGMYIAGRTGALAGDSPVKDTLSSLPAESTVPVGCSPRMLARNLVILCRESRNAPMKIESCCNLAVGAVARPSCFCLVKREPAFGMSALLNVTNLEHLLARCGASAYLNHSVNNSCDGSYNEKQIGECPSPEVKPLEPGSCRNYKVSSYLGWATVAVLTGAVAWLLVWRPAPATQIVFVPEVQLATGNPEWRPAPATQIVCVPEVQLATGNPEWRPAPATQIVCVPEVQLATGNPEWRPAPATQIVCPPEVQLATGNPENVNEDEGRSTVWDPINDDDDDDDDDTSEDSEDVLVYSKRIRNPNPKFIGGPWVGK